LRILIAIVLIISNFSFADINWANLKDAFKKAKKENKLVMIYIYSIHCQYCKKMERTTFNDKEVQNILNKYFVPVKVEKDSEEGIKVKNKYGYFGTPTFHFITSDGRKIKSLFGAWEKEDFLKILQYFYTKMYKQKSMTEYFMEE